MNSAVLSRRLKGEGTRFIARFVLLAIVSGATIGMAKLVTTLYALEHGASASQVGIISAMESLGMALFTLPAGFLIARFGARTVYSIASVGPLLLNLVIPLTDAWYWIALTQLLIGFCIPFRVVSMNSAFLGELQRIGVAKAGWYRAALLVGMGLCGPFAANALSGTLGYGWSFALVAASFGGMALFAQTFLPDEPATVAGVPGAPGALQEIRAMLANVAIGESCLVEFIAAAARASYTAFVVVIALQVLELGQGQAVQLVMIDGLAAVAALLGLGYLVRNVPEPAQYAASVALSVAGLAVLGCAGGFASFALGAVLLSVGSALVHLINMGQLSRHPAAKAKISSLFNTASMAGSFGGAMLSSALSHWIGLQQVFLAWIPVVLLLALFCWSRRTGNAALLARLVKLGHAIFPVVLLLGTWEGLAQSGWIPPQMLPTPQAVLLSGVELWDAGELQEHLRLSLGRLAAGFGAGAVGGIACGIALALSRNVRDFCGPLFELLRHLPTVALVPVFILMFGVGETLKILIVAKGVFFTVAVAVRDGVLNIPGAWFEVGTLYRLSPLRLLRRLVLPAATPAMLTGLRTGLARSWMLLVLTEQLAAEQGIGQLMEFGRQMFRMDHVLLCIVLTAAIGYALDRLLQATEQRLLKWRA